MFAATFYFDALRWDLCVILTREQLDSMRRANNPQDESANAIAGRHLLKEINDQRDTLAKRYGKCEIRLIQRWYDGAPV